MQLLFSLLKFYFSEEQHISVHYYLFPNLIRDMGSAERQETEGHEEKTEKLRYIWSKSRVRKTGNDKTGYRDTFVTKRIPLEP